jgi:hypothetical protein
VPDGPVLICGIALGYADTTAPINGYRPVRLEVDGLATLHGFEANA